MPVIVPTTTLSSGQVVPANPLPSDTFEVWLDSNGYNCLVTNDLFTYPPPSSPKSSITGVLAGARTTSTDFFGMHCQDINDIERCVSSISFDWVRTHDSGGAGGMRWFTLNPANGSFVWANSDNWINAMVAKGKKIIFLLGFTPNWCASSTPNNGKYDNGTTVTGSNQNPTNPTFFGTFATAVATRYGSSIQAYEIWNETNYSNYWAGTASQLAILTRVANQAIKAVQPTAKVVGPIVQEPETGGTGNAYLQSFLSASDGAVGTGKDWIDVCGIHMYPPKYNYQVHANQISNVQASLTAAGVGSLEIWNTETGVLQGDTIVNATQAKWLRRSIMLCAALGVAKYWWYSFDNDVMWMTDEDITAWREVRAALIGGTFSGCNIAPDGRVAATINGQRYLY